MSNIGKVIQVIGSTLDAELAPEALPKIYNGLELKNA
jgi:F0F1-type ATP synthase beta subunit